VLGLTAVLGNESAAELLLTPSITVSETFTDNEDLEPEGEEDPALITLVRPGVAIRQSSSRVTANLNAAGNFRYQALNGTGTTFDADIAGFANTEILKNLLFFDANASVSQELIDKQQATSGASANTSNLSTVQNYSASPYVTYAFGDFVDSQLRYRFGYVDFDSRDASDSLEHELRLDLDSGPQFTTVTWGVDASALRENREGSNDIEREFAALTLRLQLVDSFALLGTGGYNRFDDGFEANEVDEPLWEVGFLWTPGPRTELRFTYAERDGFESPAVSLRYQVGPKTALSAEYSEVLETSQQSVRRDLSVIGLDEDGNIIDTNTGLPFDPNTSPFSLQNSTVRRKRGVMRLTGSWGRNTFNFSTSYQEEKIELSGEEEEEVIHARGSWSRALGGNLEGNLSGGYQRTDFKALGRIDETFSANGGLIYGLSDNARANASYSFRLRGSTSSSAEFVENAVTLGVSVQF
jgi:uncharacterized protein (PEP-CTERM system associated)